MILFAMLVTAVLFFTAGMHFAIWHQGLDPRAKWWSLALALLGLYNMISLVGLASQV